jgi:hypothetical protein
LKILWVYSIPFFCALFGTPDPDFGFISYSTTNIGDDIQAIAASQFLPKESISIDREFIHDFSRSTPVNLLANGWFMHTKNVCWYLNETAPPEKSWPPSKAIRPFFISFHLTPEFIPEALTEEGVAYLKKHAPIGARDPATLEVLHNAGIPAYFSGCLTLTLQNQCTVRDDVIYAVDIPPMCLEYLRSKVDTPVVVVNHGVPLEIFQERNASKRLTYARELLKKYSRAKCVITSRLHAALPCLALETPVLLIKDCQGPRFKGLSELCRRCTVEQLLSGQFDFDFNRPSENPRDYLKIREDLIRRVLWWKESVAVENGSLPKHAILN